MADWSEQQDRPDKTLVVDLPRLPLLPTAGVLIAVAGLLLRSFARWLAWPSEWSYTGDRANTIWAYRESLYAELGLVTLIFGLALIFLAVARATAMQRQAKRCDAEQGVDSRLIACLAPGGADLQSRRQIESQRLFSRLPAANEREEAAISYFWKTTELACRQRIGRNTLKKRKDMRGNIPYCPTSRVRARGHANANSVPARKIWMRCLRR